MMTFLSLWSINETLLLIRVKAAILCIISCPKVATVQLGPFLST